LFLPGNNDLYKENLIGYVGKVERGTLFLDELDEADERQRANALEQMAEPF
jgi:hypothetical protein